MNDLTLKELEAVCYFLATHKGMFAATCMDMKVSDSNIAKLMVGAFAAKLKAARP